MALPITAMNMLVYVRAVVSVLFLGRLGSLELAGGALSIGFTNITGYSVLNGLSSGLEPVCSQAFGSRNWDLLSISLQHLLTNTLLQPLRVYLRSQGVTKPMMYCSFIAVVFHIPLNYWLVVVMGMGVPGVAIASVLTNLHMVLLMAGYVYAYGRGEWRWTAGIKDVCGGLGPLLRLAIPSCIGICLEWWWYEIVIVMAGYLPNPTLAVAATGVLIQTTSLMYTVPMALAGCVSARVGNELGAGKPYKAKLAANVALACAFVIGFINVIWTIIFRQSWGALFTTDELVKSLVASVMPLMGLCELGNCPQTTGCGILRGTARPAVGARINLMSFYFVGTPVAVGLAFGLGVGFSGLWFGLLSAQVACALSIMYSVLGRTDWEREALKAKKLTNSGLMEMSNTIGNGEESKGLLGSNGFDDVL